MAKFCPQCGTKCEDNAAFCAGCGNKLAAPAAPQQPVYQAPQQPVYQAPQQPVYQAPQQPVYQAPQQQAPAAPALTPAEKIRKNMKAFVAVFAAVMLLAGILNLFGWYDIEASVEGTNQSQSMALSEFREYFGKIMDAMGSMGSMGGDFDLGAIIDNDLLMPLIQALCFLGCSYVLGIVATIAGLFAAYALYLHMNNRAGAKKAFGRSITIGFIGSVVALVMALIGSKLEVGSVLGRDMTVEIAVHFTFWLAAIVGVAAFYIRKSVLKDDLAPLQ